MVSGTYGVAKARCSRGAPRVLHVFALSYRKADLRSTCIPIPDEN